MRKPFLFITILLLFFVFTAAQESFHFINIDIPPDAQKKKHLMFNLEDLQKLLGELTGQEIKANVRLVSPSGDPVAILAKLQGGQLKWSHKIIDNKFLRVKIDKKLFDAFYEEVNRKSRNPGYKISVTQVAFDISKTGKGKIVQSFEKQAQYTESSEAMKTYWLTFSEFPELAVNMKYPVSVAPGDPVGSKISVEVRNTGTKSTGSFNVEMVLSSDNVIPVKPANVSETFGEDMLLKDGRKTIESLKPGESVTLTFADSMTIPENTTPGRYYLGAIVDTENKIPEPDEKNNAMIQFMMISPPPPTSFTMEMCDPVLEYNPKTFDLKIKCGDIVVSDGQDWRKCRIKPYLYQITHVAWGNFFWEISTTERGVWEIKEGKFCKFGGSGKEVPIKMDVVGGSKTVMPRKISLHLKDMKLNYQPKSGKFKLLAYGNQVAYIPFWQVSRLEAHRYQFKHTNWDNYFLEVDTFKKTVSMVNGGTFGKSGGNAILMEKINLTIEEKK